MRDFLDSLGAHARGALKFLIITLAFAVPLAIVQSILLTSVTNGFAAMLIMALSSPITVFATLLAASAYKNEVEGE